MSEWVTVFPTIFRMVRYSIDDTDLDRRKMTPFKFPLNGIQQCGSDQFFWRTSPHGFIKRIMENVYFTEKVTRWCAIPFSLAKTFLKHTRQLVGNDTKSAEDDWSWCLHSVIRTMAYDDDGNGIGLFYGCLTQTKSKINEFMKKYVENNRKIVWFMSRLSTLNGWGGRLFPPKSYPCVGLRLNRGKWFMRGTYD